jgi:hypothetical protein
MLVTLDSGGENSFASEQGVEQEPGAGATLAIDETQAESRRLAAFLPTMSP